MRVLLCIRCYGVGNTDAGQAAERKRSCANGNDGVRDVDAGQALAARERKRADGSDGIGGATISDGCRDDY